MAPDNSNNTDCSLKYSEGKIKKISCSQNSEKLAGGRGFEPRLAESESAVLPLDDPPSGMRQFKIACGQVNASSNQMLYEAIAGKTVPYRPGRCEPRAV